MKKVTINLYTFDELSKEAKERALAEHNKDNFDPMLGSHLVNLVKEELKEKKIAYDTDSIDVSYSLGYSQGDGLMFEGTLFPDYGEGRKYTAIVKHSGHYYHEKSCTIDMRDETGEDADEEGKDYKQFVADYEEVCRKVRDAGYAEIEYQGSEEYFAEMCDANEYTFEEDGTMRNV